jgi:methionyl-tRNA formyltransferase
MKVVFLGTPDFAEAALRSLHASAHKVVGVVSAPDKPADRGHKLRRPAVATAAVEMDLPLAQPESLRDPIFLEWLRDRQADVFCVVAFRMLPEVIWQLPKRGTINVHGSLLPQYRGAAPIQQAVVRGEKMTGVTSFFIRAEIDTGAILLQRATPISESDTAGSVYTRLMAAGAGLLVDTLDALEAHPLEGTPQKELISILESEGIQLYDAPKLYRADGRIDWSKSAAEVHDFIRGMTPSPSAWTLLNEKPLKIHATEQPQPSNEALSSPGTCRLDKGRMWVQAADAEIELITIQAAGKPQTAMRDFLNGYRGTINRLD